MSAHVSTLRAIRPDGAVAAHEGGIVVSKWASSRKKRLFDLVISVPLTVLTLPIVLLLAVGSAISFRAWPFFTQKRLGLNGTEFTFVKLRSLPRDASTTADKYELRSVENTRWGRFLRNSKLDELPQVWLVVSGRMSLVGPRPEMPSLAATFDPVFVEDRLMVKPGCTGIWQVSTASAGLIGDASEYDLRYLMAASARLDLWLLLRTIALMARLGRPIDEHTIPSWAGAK
jgi:lipopolysaccharide/colanic/teichoic acid biosynthesis glycosyltransferase